MMTCLCRRIKWEDVSSPSKRDARRPPLNAPKAYTLDELRKATKNFCSSNVIGKGLFGTVYKGRLRNEQGAYFVAAIKRYCGDFGKEFHVELNALSRLSDRNIIRCLGSCVQKDEKILVLEHAHYGSLYNYIHYHRPLLTWTEKLTVAMGIAEGLKYLRNANVIHRDPNSSNILLDKGLVPKIAGFSSALKAFRVKEEEAMHIPFAGTKGYLDPEYRSHGSVSSAVDVYVFGVVLMELITGKPAVDPTNDTLLVAEIVTELALSCTRGDAKERPTLSDVLSALEEALRVQAKDLEGQRIELDNSQTFLL